MTRSALKRDGVLSREERDSGARRCLQVISSSTTTNLGARDLNFVRDMQFKAKSAQMHVTEPQLAWLRDICQKIT